MASPPFLLSETQSFPTRLTWVLCNSAHARIWSAIVCVYTSPSLANQTAKRQVLVLYKTYLGELCILAWTSDMDGCPRNTNFWTCYVSSAGVLRYSLTQLQ